MTDTLRKKPRLRLWDNLKFFLIVFVVLGHFSERIADYHSMRAVYTFVYFFHMPLFLFISGLFSKGVLTDKKKLLERSLGCLLTATALKAAIYLVNDDLTISFAVEKTASWYLSALVVFYPVTYLLVRTKPRLALFGSIVCACLIGYFPVGYGWNLSRLFAMYPFFYAGALFTPESISAYLKRRPIQAISGAFLAAMAIVCFCFADTLYSWKDLFRGCVNYADIGIGPWGALARLCGYAISTLFAAALISICPSRPIPVVSVIGRRTLQVYFWHCPVIYGGLRIGLFSALVATLQDYLPGGLWQIGYLISGLILILVLSIPLFGRPLQWLMKPLTSCKVLKER